MVSAPAVLIWVACAATGTMVMSRPELPPNAMSGYMVLLQLGVCDDVHGPG